MNSLQEKLTRFKNKNLTEEVLLEIADEIVSYMEEYKKDIERSVRSINEHMVKSKFTEFDFKEFFKENKQGVVDLIYKPNNNRVWGFEELN